MNCVHVVTYEAAPHFTQMLTLQNDESSASIRKPTCVFIGVLSVTGYVVMKCHTDIRANSLDEADAPLVSLRLFSLLQTLVSGQMNQ